MPFGAGREAWRLGAGLWLGLSWPCGGGSCSERPPRLELVWGPCSGHLQGAVVLPGLELSPEVHGVSCDLWPREDFSHACSGHAQPRVVFS